MRKVIKGVLTRLFGAENILFFTPLSATGKGVSVNLFTNL
jgi:hypothetical protein